MNKRIKVIIVATVLFLFLIPVIILLNYISLAYFFSNFFETIANLTGINKYLVNALMILFFIPFIYGISNLLSINKKRRRTGIIVLATLFIMYNLALYFLTKNVYFSFSEGMNLKWYALTPEGVKYYDRPGIEPNYGIKLKPVTPEIIKNLKLLEYSDFKPVNPINALFFNPITGEATLWYYRHPDNTFDFFNNPGYHPITGEVLQPVTKTVYYEWEKYSNLKNKVENKSEGKKSGSNMNFPKEQKLKELDELSDFNSTIIGITSVNNQPRIAIVIESVNESYGLTDIEFSNKIELNDFEIVSQYFKDTFKSKGYFNKIFEGEISLLNNSRVFNDVNFLILGKLDYTFRKSISFDKDLISCDINLSYKVLNTQGSVIKSDAINAVGAGFSEELSTKQAVRALAEKYSNILTSIL